jgi:DNA polymerase III gamma/tau subunit
MIPPLPPLPGYAPQPVLLNTAVPEETSEIPRHRIFHHRAKTEAAENHTPETNRPAQQPAQNQEVASAPPSDVSPIGQLSTATGDGAPTDRDAIAKLIDSTEKGLDAFKHPLNSREQKTAAQIRTFIAHARDSLKTNDLDGARTLAVKAQLLLQELTGQ